MKQPAGLYFIAHFDSKIVKGSPLGSRDSGWTSLPAEPMKHLEYVMPYGDSIVLHGYDEYLHMVEAVQKIGGLPKIEYVYLMGRKGKQVVSYRISLLQVIKNSRFKIGDITVRVVPSGQEHRGKPVSGWRLGVNK